MRILLVDDEEELLKVVSKVLTLNNYVVDESRDGLEALAYLNYQSYDLIIMDIMMPRMDGITCLKEIRNKKISTPVLLLSAKSEIDDKVEGLDDGADDYLTKPFQVKELLARVKALTRRTSSTLSSLGFSNLSLDSSSYEMKAIKSIRLTNKEYQLMEFFIRHQKAYFNADALLEAIWQEDSDADVNTIWVFISTLRKKLETIGAKVTIKSLRGVGYRLEEI